MQYSSIHYQPERVELFLGSPSIARVDDHTLVATCDYFTPDEDPWPQRPLAITSIHHSYDNGETWQWTRNLQGGFWCTLFELEGKLYLLGNDRKHGNIIIRRSDDGGYQWTCPADEKTGLLRQAGVSDTPPNYHGAPVPVCIHDGRIYRAFEDNVSTHWPTGFEAFVMSASLNSDLLAAESWTQSNQLAFDRNWLPKEEETCQNPGWLEGNIVVDPKGQLWNILRTHIEPEADKIAKARVLENGARTTFDPKSGFADMPGGSHKFTIRRDPETGWYVTLVNNNTEPDHFSQRNILSLAVSPDLTSWRVVKTLMCDESGLRPKDSLRFTGFQYADWQFDGDDLIAAIRVAYRGARNFHDSNRIVFQRIDDFRRHFSD